MKKENPRTIQLNGTISGLIGIAFLVYSTHPIGPNANAEWSKLIVTSIGIPLALVNIGLVLWATGTILQKLEEIKKSHPDKG